MAKPKSTYRCTACEASSPQWVGRCSTCGEWGTVEESTMLVTGGAQRTTIALPSTPAQPITMVTSANHTTIATGIGELDRVLGKGIVPGSAILLAGEPGVGKSTLLLEVAKQIAVSGRRTLYVTGEESAAQVRLRAERTNAVHENIFLAAESDLGTVLGHAEQVSPTIMIVDSVQTMHAGQVDGVAGGVTQIRAITTALVSLAKNSGIAVILVGHVTKDGTVAGPRSLEHLVDVVLAFEGDKHSALRMVRGIKNRFGSADEVGCFEQREDGIHEVPDPSGLFLHHREGLVTGSAITVAMDGKRALVAEIQALAPHSAIPSPRRTVSGIENSRVAMILAVLQSRIGINSSNRDVYVSTVGGMKISEPAADLGIALALASTIRDTALPRHTVVFGELGLGGEVRRVNAVNLRVAEAKRLGFTHAIVPAGSENLPKGIKVSTVSTIADAINLSLNDGRN